jgi:hypothetical protein
MSMNRSGGRADFNSGAQFAGFYLPFDGRVPVRLPQAKGAFKYSVYGIAPCAGASSEERAQS